MDLTFEKPSIDAKEVRVDSLKNGDVFYRRVTEGFHLVISSQDCTHNKGIYTIALSW